MRQDLIVVLFFLSTLTGCGTSISSETGVAGADGPGGAFWYVRDGAFSSRVFHCPPQTQVGPHRCTEAEIVDYAIAETTAPPPPQMVPQQMPPPQPMAPQPMAPQPMAPQPMAPQPMAPQPMLPRQMMPAPTTGGCTSDLDCKGGRICRNRVCYQP